MVDNFTSVEEHEVNPSFQLWPNPNNGDFNISASVNDAGTYTVLAYNMIGKMVAQQSRIYLDGENSFNLNLGHLPEGLYFLVIEGQGEKMVRKLIINH